MSSATLLYTPLTDGILKAAGHSCLTLPGGGEPMICIAIVEDDENSATSLQNYIERYQREHELDCRLVFFKNGLEFISSYHPIFDVIFMDIKMPHLDGMQAAKKLREMDEETVLLFITSMAQYAIRGYEVDALDFILKPVKYYDFEMKFSRVLRYIEKHKDTRITITLGDVIKRVSIRDLYYIEVINHTLIYHAAGHTYQAYGQLKNLEETLASCNFVKCNSCYLVNLRHITEVRSNSILIHKDEIPISRRRKKDFMKSLADYMGGGF